MGTKKYKTILVDPPWQVKAGRDISGYKVVNGKQVFTQEHQKSRELAYPTMSIHEISSLPISDLACENCHLYLWTINKYVNNAYSIVRKWGFFPSTLLVWAKNPMGCGLGGAFGISTEFILFCRKGSLPAKQKIKGTWWNWKRPYDERGKPKHSSKPEQLQTIIESVSPGPYLEMFARRKRVGWDSWGNEIECNIEIKEHAQKNTLEILKTKTNNQMDAIALCKTIYDKWVGDHGFSTYSEFCEWLSQPEQFGRLEKIAQQYH